MAMERKREIRKRAEAIISQREDKSYWLKHLSVLIFAQILLFQFSLLLNLTECFNRIIENNNI